MKKRLTGGKGKFLANTGWIVFDKVFHMVLSLVIMSITARYLGKTNYGILNYGLSFVNIFVTVCKLGIDAILVSELVKGDRKQEELIGTTIVLRMCSGLLGILITGLFVCILKPGNLVILFVSLIEAVSLLFNAFDTIDYYFQFQLKSKYTSIAKSISYVCVCVLRIVLVALKASVTWFAIATIVDAAAIAVGLLYFYRKSKMSFSFSIDTAKYLLKNSSPFILASMLTVIYTQMDKIMVGSLNTEAEVGIYTAAMNIANMWMFIPIAIIDSARPIIMQNHHEGKADYMKRFVQLSRFICLLGTAAGIFFTIFPKLVVWILYGKQYMDAVAVLMVLIWSRMFSLLGTTRTIWLICEGKQRYAKWFVGTGAVINVILNTLWIPQSGALGAATATLITECVCAIVLPLLLRDTRGVVLCIFKGR